MAETKLLVTRLLISFVSGDDKHVAVDIADVPQALKLLGKSPHALALGDVVGFGEELLNATEEKKEPGKEPVTVDVHEDATKIHISVDSTGKEPVLAVSPQKALQHFRVTL